MSDITVKQMQELQNNNYNVMAEYARPLLLNNVVTSGLDEKEKEYLNILKIWNLKNDPEEKAPVIFNAWWDSLEVLIYADELHQKSIPVIQPEPFVLVEGLLRDSVYKFTDDMNTPAIETLPDMVTAALKKASVGLKQIESEGKMEWAKFKNTSINHLLRDATAPFARKGLMNGGGYGILNATKTTHGPSWRMVVSLTTPVTATVVYPGGQSGNPGSKYYDNFVDAWTVGQYYDALFLTKQDVADPKIKWTMTFKP